MKKRFGGHKKKFAKRPFYKTASNDEVARQIRAVEIVSKKKPNEASEAQTYSSQNSFGDFGLSERLLENINYKKYEDPTPIQDKVIPAIMQGFDVIGIANTGTGKTAAFIIPLVEKVVRNSGEKILIIAPTRELAIQINEELKEFGRGLGIRAVLAIGGMSLGRQKMELRQQAVQFVVGTPGRIKELVQERILNLGEFHNVVLDEADRMVDIGFIHDIKYFISLLPQKRQSLFFSATIGKKEKIILDAFVHNPVTISVKTQETAENIDQQTIQVPREQKLDKLHDLLIQPGYDKVLVFGRTKWGVQKLTGHLLQRGFKAEAIHGNKNQNQRQRALEKFKKSEIQILLATDVASRGLDIQDVTHVINYDMPATYDDYVHRIGRTGRAEKKGVALTFVE